MSLWIRSQDRELLMKSPEFRYNQKNDNHSILAYDTMGVYRILGTYKTKERALEVLDEIEKYIENHKRESKLHIYGLAIPKFVFDGDIDDIEEIIQKAKGDDKK